VTANEIAAPVGARQGAIPAAARDAAGPVEAGTAATPPTAAVTLGPLPLTAAKFGTTQWTHAELLRALAGAGLSNLHSVGHTSTVFRANLEAPFRAAYKLDTRERSFAPIAEVMAYRLATCLGINNVPPAILRNTTRTQLQQLLAPESLDRWPTIASGLQPGEAIQGATIFWIEGLQDAPFAKQAHGPNALDSASLPTTTAAALTTMQIFDYLIGNWDRWSGGNIKTDHNGNLYIHDNDAAFPKHLTTQQEQRLLDPIQTQLPTNLIQNLKNLTPESLSTALAQDPTLKAQPNLIDSTRLEAFQKRRTKLLTKIQQAPTHGRHP